VSRAGAVAGSRALVNSIAATSENPIGPG